MMLRCSDIEDVLGETRLSIRDGVEGGNKARDKCIVFFH